MEKKKQIIVSIDREFSSGGREIADYIGADLGIPVYEKNILQLLGIPNQKDVEDLFYCDESPRWKLTSRTVRGLTNSNEANLAALEFDCLQKMAQEGQSFVILGHCAEEVLKDFDCMTTVFVSADEEFKMERAEKESNITAEEALAKMHRHDRKRKSYHNSYCPNKWGDSRFYDLCIRSSSLGCRQAADVIEQFIEAREKWNSPETGDSSTESAQ